MKIRLVSDTHLDFYSGYDPRMFVVPNEKSKTDEILILAGDVCEWKREKMFVDFIEWASENFCNVLYVGGNHEFYGLDYFSSKKRIKNLLIGLDNFYFLDLEECKSEGFVDLFDHRFIGTTLWTDFNKNNPLAKIQSADFMNDYRLIRNGEYKSKKNKISPQFLYELNRRSGMNLKELVEQSELPVAVITHHAPHELSHDSRYKLDEISFSFFNTNLEDFIFSNSDKIHLWCHGHIHCGKDYQLGETRVVANPAGYPNRAGILNENREFSSDFSIVL